MLLQLERHSNSVWLCFEQDAVLGYALRSRVLESTSRTFSIGYLRCNKCNDSPRFVSFYTPVAQHPEVVSNTSIDNASSPHTPLYIALGLPLDCFALSLPSPIQLGTPTASEFKLPSTVDAAVAPYVACYQRTY